MKVDDAVVDMSRIDTLGFFFRKKTRESYLMFCRERNVGNISFYCFENRAVFIDFSFVAIFSFCLAVIDSSTKYARKVL